MSFTPAMYVGKAIFHLLKTNAGVTSVDGMNTQKIQPAPMIQQGQPTAGVIYEITAVNPVNVKRVQRFDTAPLYNVNITLECIHENYGHSIILADKVTRCLQENQGTFNGIKYDGFTLETMTETYNKEKRYYSKLLSFSGRILL